MTSFNPSNIFAGSIQNLFGSGLLGTAVTGLVRIPAFMANCTAVLMVGELAIRGLSNSVAAFGFKQNDDSWIAKTAEGISSSGIRPFKNLDNSELAIKAVAFAALGIIGSEFIRVAGGSTPQIYNHVLAFLGPIRIDTGSYLDGLAPIIGKIWS